MDQTMKQAAATKALEISSRKAFLFYTRMTVQLDVFDLEIVTFFSSRKILSITVLHNTETRIT